MGITVLVTITCDTCGAHFSGLGHCKTRLIRRCRSDGWSFNSGTAKCPKCKNISYEESFTVKFRKKGRDMGGKNH